MPYYKDKTNHLHYLDSDDFYGLLPEGSVQISDAEAVAIRELLKTSAPITPVTSVSMRQARLALLQAGFLPAIDAEMSSDEQKIWWDYSPTVERDNSFVIQVTAKLGISEAQVDDLFTLASTL